jgi:transcription elongation factor GreA
MIARSNVIDVTTLEKKDNVIFGSTVCITNLENNEKKIYKIVGKEEADIAKNYIYFRSPIGKALIGKKKKELVTVITPSGEKNFEIMKVEYI